MTQTPLAPLDGNKVEVIEPPSDRVRRPTDLFALLFALVALFAAVSLGIVAVGTASGLEQDLVGAGGALPRALLHLISWAGGIGLLVLLVVKGVDLVVRSRSWQLFEAVTAAGVSALLALVLQRLVLDGRLGSVLAALTKGLPDDGRTEPLDGLIVASVAFFTVSGVGGRSILRRAAIVVVGSAILSGFLSGGVTALALFASALLGWVVGLLAHLAWGVTSNRPPGTAVAAALISCGLDITRLELVKSAPGAGRWYAGSGPAGLLNVRVLDRDTFGTAASRRLLRRMRLRGPSTRGPSVTVRAAVEHHALMAMAVAKAGVRAPELLATAEVGPFAAVLAYRPPEGQALDHAGSRPLSDDNLAAFWQLLMVLQRTQIAHRGLSVDNLLLDERGQAGLRETGTGDIAAADLSLRIDVAQLLTTLALLVGPQRAVASGVSSLGSAAIVRALPLVQTVAMGASTRSALRAQKGLLRRVRELVLELAPEGEPSEPIELRRLTPRTLVTVLGGGIAAYVLLTQLAQVNVGQVLALAQWGWALAVLGFTALTIAGASLVITGAVTARLSFVRTYLTQLTVAFSGLVAPSAIGNIALNLRYLQLAGVDPAVAAGSVGLAQLAQFSSYFILLLLSSVLAGTGPRASFTPPLPAVIGLIVVVALLLLALAVPAGRRLVIGRFLPVVRRVVPRVVAIFQDPRKVVTLFAGALLLDLSFVAALTCATRAFGATPSIPAVAVVYFAGAIIGSAVPTPGGLGGVEAALSAGLVAVGLNPGIAVSSVLLFRLCTYWLPIPFGWASLNYLQRVAAI
ncbi:MAG: flippase-like domain-containing protein [Actinobacteria bacterium]|nr:flippase-like domain-containing protein [Actinomycetota bacterium]